MKVYQYIKKTLKTILKKSKKMKSIKIILFLAFSPLSHSENLIDSARVEYYHGLHTQLSILTHVVGVVGSNDASWAIQAFKDAGLEWKESGYGVTSALVIGSPQILITHAYENPAIVVGGRRWALAGKYIQFTSRSILIIDVQGIGDRFALDGGQHRYEEEKPGLYIDRPTGGDERAAPKLLLVNPIAGRDIKIATNFINKDFLKWNGHIYTNNRLIDMSQVRINENGIIPGFQIRLINSERALPGLKMVNSVNTIFVLGLNDLNSDNPGIEFVTKGLDTSYISDENLARNVLNSAALISELGGHQRANLDINNSIKSSILNHRFNEANNNIWIDYTNSQNNFDNKEFENKNKLNGFTIGKDYLLNDKSILGVAFSFGKGDIDSKGNFQKTENKYKYYGASVYYKKEFENFNLTSYLGAIRNSGDISQNNFLEKINANLDSRVFSLGAEVESKNKILGLTPYFGIEGTSLVTTGFDTKSSKGVMFETEKSIQNIISVPIGLKYEKSYFIKIGKITPFINLEMSPTFLEKEIENVIKVKNINAKDRIKSKIIGSSVFLGRFGFEVKRDNLSYELRYEFKKSSISQISSIGFKIEYIF